MTCAGGPMCSSFGMFCLSQPIWIANCDVELAGAITSQHGSQILGWSEHHGVDRDLAGIPVIGVLDEPNMRGRFPVFKHVGAVRHHLAGLDPVLAEPDGLLVDRHGLLHHQHLQEIGRRCLEGDLDRALLGRCDAERGHVELAGIDLLGVLDRVEHLGFSHNRPWILHAAE